MKICALIPTYNNVTTAASVVRQVLVHLPVIVVVDGADDGTLESVSSIDDENLTIVSYAKNRGKGYALKTGFKKARELGYTHVLTMDSDGQHLASEVPQLLRIAKVHTDSIIIGARRLVQKNMPGKNSFANKFSNFWFAVQTGKYLPDTQTGMRVYPLDRIHGECFMTNRYEAELMLLVFSAWANVQIIPVPIRVFYPDRKLRVSYFSPVKDFTRISILNTILLLLAVVYGLPRRWILSLCYGALFVLDALLYVNPAIFILRLMGKERLVKTMLYKNGLFLMKALPCTSYNIKYENGATPIGSNGPEVVIMNHNSLLDSQVILSLGVDMACLAAPWVGKNFFFGQAVKASGAIFSDKPIDELLVEFKKVVEGGRSILFYPEGTRSVTGLVGRFHPGAFYVAQQLGLPIRPLFMWDIQQSFGKMEFHIGFPKSNTLRIYPTVNVDDYRGCCKSMRKWYQQMEENYENLD